MDCCLLGFFVVNSLFAFFGSLFVSFLFVRVVVFCGLFGCRCCVLIVVCCCVFVVLGFVICYMFCCLLFFSLLSFGWLLFVVCCVLFVVRGVLFAVCC